MEKESRKSFSSGLCCDLA